MRAEGVFLREDEFVRVASDWLVSTLSTDELVDLVGDALASGESLACEELLVEVLEVLARLVLLTELADKVALEVAAVEVADGYDGVLPVTGAGDIVGDSRLLAVSGWQLLGAALRLWAEGQAVSLVDAKTAKVVRLLVNDGDVGYLGCLAEDSLDKIC